MKHHALILSLIGSPALAQTVPIYADETASAGISHSFTGEWEFMVGGGTAVFDCSGDGKPEVFIAGGTAPATLWRNDSATGGPLAFSPLDLGAGLDSVAGAYPLDIDGDGITDLAVLRVGKDVLLRGQGDCKFTDATAEWGFQPADDWTTAFAATWEAGASLPTLAFGNYIDRTEEAFPWGSCTDNLLYRPDGTTYAAPIPLTPSFCTLSMLFTDWNRSGMPSLRVSNDREYYKGGQEQMWHLPAAEAPRLYTADDGWQRLRIWGMGIASRDLDGDTYPEYFLTSMADNKLQALKAPGAGVKPQYADVAFAKGVTAHRPYTGGEFKPSTAWHSQFEDVNNDGRVDLFVAKGNVSKMPDFAMNDPNNLLLQAADGTFVEAGDKAGVASMKVARGAAVADFNADGAMDLLVVNRNAPTEIWRNTGPVGNWLAVSLSQPGPNHAAIGSWIEVRIGDALQRIEVTVGGGHAGGVLAPAHFGLGAADKAEVRVIWPDGSESSWQAAAANGAVTLSR